MKWIKLGQIFKVDNNNTFLVSHAANPLAIHLKDDVFRVFYSGRDLSNKSSVSFVDIDIKKLSVEHVCKDPLAIYGDKGSFYSHGISIGNVYKGLDAKELISFKPFSLRDIFLIAFSKLIICTH